ncbi:DUF6264 family protein [Microbacterium elymi]|uniref:DUF6264 family protein n=1 Tax=Microbacterium elymi TaxID=2909587 RepID=A0ABY5NKB0_9MICO|nr:DUF6264 family protein [Microbacterium elymi]UUT35566.1 DUF6264 family protein [Microbacterium elymi]
MTTPDPRPRPQYGEYASPEEQRAHIAHPTEHAHAQPSPDAVAPATRPATRPAASAAAPARPGAEGRASSHPVDRIVTLALLGYGVINVILSVFSFLDLAAVADQTYKLMGIPGSFTDTSAARIWGIVAAVVLVLGYLVTAALALRRLRRGRIAWWIPLVGAAITYILVSVCMAVPLMSDPAFLEYLLSSR